MRRGKDRMKWNKKGAKGGGVRQYDEPLETF